MTRLTKDEIDCLSIALTGLSTHLDQPHAGEFARIYRQLLSEHAVMREALRWRMQSEEAAPEDESPVLVIFPKGNKRVEYPGCVEPNWEFWLPIPPLNKE